MRVCVCVILLEVDTQSQLPPPPPCTNLLQTKTKRTQRRGFSASRFFSSFSSYSSFLLRDVSFLLFKDLTFALQVKQKTLPVNWLGSPNFSGFFDATRCGKVQYSTRLPWKKVHEIGLRLFCVLWVTRGLCSGEQVQKGAVDFFFSSSGCFFFFLLLRKQEETLVSPLVSPLVSQLKVCMFYLSFTSQNLSRVSIKRHFCRVRTREELNPGRDVYSQFSF